MLKKYKFVILGAGPAGLSLANRLIQLGEKDFVVLEKNDEAGGLCRSKVVDDAPLDIGGGHFLDVRNPGVLEFLFGFMPENEWDIFNRDSRIDLGRYVINSPIEANIWQMPQDDQIRYLKSIAIAGCNLEIPMPEKFVDWIYWKLGKSIADDYMIPYNKKMFGADLNSLGTYWLNKLPNVSFDETLISCLERKAYGTQPGHARFYYPCKFGYGELWLRMAKKLGERIHYNEPVVSINYDERAINDKYEADCIITTIPWTGVEQHMGVPSDIMNDIDSLRYSSVVINYIKGELDTNAQWIYCPDERLSYHRILVQHNFCPRAHGYWTETNLARFNEYEHENETYFINEYAYPLNTIGKQEAMQRIITWAKEKNVEPLGRWGEWQHYNSDVVVDLAIKKADELLRKIGDK